MASAKAALARAQRDTQEAFARYTACLDTEAQIRQQLSIAEERRDALSEQPPIANRDCALYSCAYCSGLSCRELPE